MKRIVVFTLSILFLFAGALLAQTRPAAPGGMQGPAGPSFQRGSGDPLADYLALTADQKAAWQTIREETGQAIRPLHEQGRDLADQLESTTDSAAIGALVLQMRGLSSQIDAAREAADAKFAAILTADQQMRFDAFQAASEFLHQRGPGGPPPPRH